MKNIKKVLFPLFAITFLTLSCTGNDDTNLPNNEHEPEIPAQTKHFHPPAWIKGKWIFKDPPMVQNFKFTDDDVITDNSSFNDLINQSKNKTNVIAMEAEYSSNESYTFIITTRSKTSNLYDENTYRFFKKNDTLMMRLPDIYGPYYYIKVKE